jgi:murein DD-endopeptidase MepM/ murein hydrolase activator NlpD
MARIWRMRADDNQSAPIRPIRVLRVLFLILALALAPGALPVVAQDSGVYVVAPGDTLGAIAARFGISLDALVAANGIADPNRLVAGQQLLIPGAAGNLPAATAGVAIEGIETGIVQALPGESVVTLAARYGQDAALVAGLNGLAESTRFFPGQPVKLPAASTTSQPIFLGPVTGVEISSTITQGRTGRLAVTTSRPLALNGTWLGQPLVFTSAAPDGLRQVALLPVPALQEAGTYAVDLSFTTARGVPVTRTWPAAVDDGGYEFQQIVVSDEKASQMTQGAILAERDKVVGLWSQINPELYWQGPFLRPIDAQYATTSGFGTRRDYSVSDIGTFHAGQDFGAPEGALVTAPASGVVVMAEPMTVRGNAVIIDHGRGIFTGYWHFSEMKVAPGQAVGPGDVIGLVGNTGLSTGAHLHWELRVNGIAVDPMQFLDEALFP